MLAQIEALVQQHKGAENDEVVNLIYRTKDYSKFKLSPYNRAVAEERKDRIKRAISEDNLIADNPLGVEEDFTVLVGQGRLLALCELQLPVCYMFLRDVTMDKIRKMSDEPGVWSLEDNFNYWLIRKSPAYVTLKQFLDSYPWLTISNGIALIGKGHTGGRYYKSKFNDGEFHPGNLMRGIAVAEVIKDYEKWFPYYRNHGFVSVMKNIANDPKYDHKRMMSKMEAYHSLLTRQASADQYYAVLSEIYNKHARQETKYHFHKPTRENKS
jgi:hypothetical protein